MTCLLLVSGCGGQIAETAAWVGFDEDSDDAILLLAVTPPASVGLAVGRIEHDGWRGKGPKSRTELSVKEWVRRGQGRADPGRPRVRARRGTARELQDPRRGGPVHVCDGVLVGGNRFRGCGGSRDRGAGARLPHLRAFQRSPPARLPGDRRTSHVRRRDQARRDQRPGIGRASGQDRGHSRVTRRHGGSSPFHGPALPQGDGASRAATARDATSFPVKAITARCRKTDLQGFRAYGELPNP